MAEFGLPSLLVGGPGILILVVVGGQLLGAAAWISLARRSLGERLPGRTESPTDV